MHLLQVSNTAAVIEAVPQHSCSFVSQALLGHSACIRICNVKFILAKAAMKYLTTRVFGITVEAYKHKM